MSTHIALIGKSQEPVLRGIQHYGGVKKLYLLHSPNSDDFKFKDLALQVKANQEAAGFDGVVLREIDAFDMNSIINAIIEIVDREEKPYFINMTGGTNLMAGAACAASFFVGAKAYYVIGKRGESGISKIIELPVPNIPYYRNVQEAQLRVLDGISKLGGRTSNSRLRVFLEIPAQNLSYHLKQLAEKGLVSVARGQPLSQKEAGKVDNRILMVELTNAGKLVLGWSALKS